MQGRKLARGRLGSTSQRDDDGTGLCLAPQPRTQQARPTHYQTLCSWCAHEMFTCRMSNVYYTFIIALTIALYVYIKAFINLINVCNLTQVLLKKKTIF